MEISWAERQLQHYAEEARQIGKHLQSGEADDFYVERALNFLHSFLSMPPDLPGYADSLLAVADQANFLYLYIHYEGRWSEIIYLLTNLVA